MGSNSAHCSFVPTTCFSWTLGFQPDFRTVPGVGLTVGKAAFLHLKPWADFIKEQEQHRLFKLWENELFFLYIYIFK